MLASAVLFVCKISIITLEFPRVRSLDLCHETLLFWFRLQRKHVLFFIKKTHDAVTTSNKCFVE